MYHLCKEHHHGNFLNLGIFPPHAGVFLRRIIMKGLLVLLIIVDISACCVASTEGDVIRTSAFCLPHNCTGE